MKALINLIIMIALFPASSEAGWFTSDGNTFNECLENRRDEINNNAQLQVAIAYCRSKFPPPPPPPQNGSYRFAALGKQAKAVGKLVDKVEIYDKKIKGDFVSYEVLNRNDFEIGGLIIGGLDKSVKECSTNEKDFAEIYSCDYGYVKAKNSGSVRCNIPGLNKRHPQLCTIGLLVYMSELEVAPFMKKYRIPLQK